MRWNLVAYDCLDKTSWIIIYVNTKSKTNWERVCYDVYSFDD